MSELSEMLRNAVGTPDPWFEASEVRETAQRRRLRRPILSVAISGAVGVVVIAGLTMLVVRDGSDRTSAGDSSNVGSSAEEAEVGTWSAMADAPLSPRTEYAQVWTGQQLFVWSGTTLAISTSAEDDEVAVAFEGGDVTDDGAIYDPRTDTWDVLPTAPISGRSSPAAVWAGNEVVVWGGIGAQDGAAYRPATNTWRMLPSAPIDGRAPVAAVWTGTEVVVWGDRNRDDPQPDGAAYNPATDRWRIIPDAPLSLNQGSAVWTGQEMIVVASQLDPANSPLAAGADSLMTQVLSYEPAMNRWRTLAPVDLSPQASFAVWDGRQVIAWDYELKARRMTPADDAWTPLPSVPVEATECYPTGAVTSGMAFAHFCGVAAVLDITELAWHPLDRALPRDATPISVGEELIVWGVVADDPDPVGVRYRPG